MKIVIALENIRSVYNVGSIFRTGEGFGITDFVLIGITPTPLDKYGNKRKDFIKTALGAEDRINWSYASTTHDVLEMYPNHTVISLEISDKSKDINELKNDLDPNGNYLVFIGSEVDGVSDEALSHSAHTYHIPMRGEKESFNVSVATGILFYLLTTR